MKLTLQQVDMLYVGHVELLEQGLSPRLIYKLLKNKKTMQPHIETIQETITKVNEDSEGLGREEVIKLQNEAIEELFKDEVELDLKEIEWAELPHEIKGTTIDKIEAVMTGEL